MYPLQATMLLATVSASLFCGQIQADPIAPTDLDGLALGAKIVGPVGPEVETTFVNLTDQGIGDLISSVSCPGGIAQCVPPNNPTGTIYTYAHQVTPGVDLPNDPPFPSPDVITALDDVEQFRLGFVAEGFSGIAGFSFTDAASALGTPDAITIEHLDDGSLAWNVSTDAWDTGESITLFWQTTQPPSGPGGTYIINNGVTVGSGAGPLPIPVPEPGTAVILAGLMVLVCTRTTPDRD